MLPTTLLALGLAAGAVAHSQKPEVAADANWMTKHMAEEHHMANFDAASFFTLHDFDADGQWEPSEMLRTYGLDHESNAHVTDLKRLALSSQLLHLLDTNHDGFVSRAEFVTFIEGGNTLPDLGTGPGHHGDDEYEYEIHHWEKYHDENTKLEDLTHPEDVEHFRKHEEMEEAEERMERFNQIRIVESNIPSKFKRT